MVTPRRFISVPNILKAQTLLDGLTIHGTFGITIEVDSDLKTAFKVSPHIRFYHIAPGLVGAVAESCLSEPPCAAIKVVSETKSNKQLGVSVSIREALRDVIARLLDPIQQANSGEISPDKRTSQQYRFWRGFLEVNDYYTNLYGEVEPYATEVSIYVAFAYYVTLILYNRQYMRTPEKEWAKVLNLAEEIRTKYQPITSGEKKDVENLANITVVSYPAYDPNASTVTPFPEIPMIEEGINEFQQALLYGDIDITDVKNLLKYKDQLFHPELFPADQAWPPQECPAAPFPFPKKGDPDYPVVDPNGPPWEVWDVDEDETYDIS